MAVAFLCPPGTQQGQGPEGPRVPEDPHAVGEGVEDRPPEREPRPAGTPEGGSRRVPYPFREEGEALPQDAAGEPGEQAILNSPNLYRHPLTGPPVGLFRGFLPCTQCQRC